MGDVLPVLDALREAGYTHVFLGATAGRDAFTMAWLSPRWRKRHPVED